MTSVEDLVESKIASVSPNSQLGSLEIVLVSADGKRSYVIEASGVDDFLVDEMRSNNLVDEVACYPENVMDDCSISRLYYLLRGSEFDFSDRSWCFIDQKLKDINSGLLHYWEIRPVIDAVIRILAKDISIRLAEQGRVWACQFNCVTAV